MQSETKRIKIEELSPPARKMQFTDLIEDCIFEIFCQLAPDDLCSMSFTCKYLQTLAFNQFQRQYPEQFITISLLEKKDGKILIDSNYNGKHVKYFSKFIQNIRILALNSDTKQLFDFVKTECAPKLKILDIITSVNILPRDVEIIKDKLKNLEILDICIDSNTENNSKDTLMKYCKNLKRLNVDIESIDPNSGWLLQHYPKLESLKIHFCGNLSCIEECTMLAGRFIRNNPQIKDFSCHGDEMMKSILQNAVDIKRLAIEIIGLNEISRFLDDLKSYCTKNPIECLEFKLHFSDFSDIKMLKDFNQIVPIHGLIINKYYIEDPSAIPIIMDFKNLKKLKLVNCFNGEAQSVEFDSIEKLSKGMLRLEEIKLYISADNDDYVKKCLMLFVRNSVSMKKLKFIMDSKYIEFNRNDFLVMNATRLRLPGSCSMKIHLVHWNVEGNSMEKVFNIPSDVNATKCMIGD